MSNKKKRKSKRKQEKMKNKRSKKKKNKRKNRRKNKKRKERTKKEKKEQKKKTLIDMERRTTRPIPQEEPTPMQETKKRQVHTSAERNEKNGRTFRVRLFGPRTLKSRTSPNTHTRTHDAHIARGRKHQESPLRPEPDPGAVAEHNGRSQGESREHEEGRRRGRKEDGWR